jgi:hypothetical protein
MYLRRITVRNVKCFDDLTLSFVDDKAGIRRWTALLGQNGLGKSTLLQAMAVALAGPGATRELVPVAEGWTRKDANYGDIEAELQWTEGDAQLPRWPKKTPYRCRYLVSGPSPESLPKGLSDPPTVPSIIEWSGAGGPRERETAAKDMSRLRKTAYAEGKNGWLACGYGPFRRLSGGSQDADKILYSGRKAARFVTLFREDAALTNATEWLVALHNTAREGDERNRRALEHVKGAFANDFLPEPAELHVTARSAQLRIGSRDPIGFQQLSDGYRSMLALGLDLLRWLLAAFPEVEKPLEAPAVVLIDELDAHLHPIWQQQIGWWLPAKFPNIQFIVATHSPFLAQVADEIGGNIVLRETRGAVQADTEERSVAAWRADQILIELFGLRSTRSPIMEKRLLQFLSLAQKKRSQTLSDVEEEQYQGLLPFYEQIPPSVEDPKEREVALLLKQAVRKHASALKSIE